MSATKATGTLTVTVTVEEQDVQLTMPTTRFTAGHRLTTRSVAFPKPRCGAFPM
jgi:hypothetical protein